MTEKFCIKKRINSFTFAIRGIFILIQSEHNAWIHFVATILVIAAGYFLRISRIEWVSIVVAVTLVWIAEALNTAIEILCDRVSRDQDQMIKKSKDIAAGAVLLAAISAAAIGVIVFLPHILSLLYT